MSFICLAGRRLVGGGLGKTKLKNVAHYPWGSKVNQVCNAGVDGGDRERVRGVRARRRGSGLPGVPARASEGRPSPSDAGHPHSQLHRHAQEIQVRIISFFSCSATRQEISLLPARSIIRVACIIFFFSHRSLCVHKNYLTCIQRQYFTKQFSNTGLCCEHQNR